MDEKQNNQKKIVEPSILSGFMELLPKEQMILYMKFQTLLLRQSQIRQPFFLPIFVYKFQSKQKAAVEASPATAANYFLKGILPLD